MFENSYFNVSKNPICLVSVIESGVMRHLQMYIQFRGGVAVSSEISLSRVCLRQVYVHNKNPGACPKALPHPQERGNYVV